jgi:DNA-directed RNA polymerase subunit RPC12/RpoP
MEQIKCPICGSIDLIDIVRGLEIDRKKSLKCITCGREFKRKEEEKDEKVSK